MNIVDVMQFYQALDRYSTLERDLPKKVTWAVGANRRRLKHAAEEYQQNMQDVVRKYAERDGAGNMIPSGPTGVKIDPAKSEEYMAEVKEINDIDIDVDIYMVDFAALPDNFPPSILTGLQPMLRDPPEDGTVVPLQQAAE